MYNNTCTSHEVRILYTFTFPHGCSDIIWAFQKTLQSFFEWKMHKKFSRMSFVVISCSSAYVTSVRGIVGTPHLLVAWPNTSMQVNNLSTSLSRTILNHRKLGLLSDANFETHIIFMLTISCIFLSACVTDLGKSIPERT